MAAGFYFRTWKVKTSSGAMYSVYGALIAIASSKVWHSDADGAALVAGLASSRVPEVASGKSVFFDTPPEWLLSPHQRSRLADLFAELARDVAKETPTIFEIDFGTNRVFRLEWVARLLDFHALVLETIGGGDAVVLDLPPDDAVIVERERTLSH